jgi:hypothetical protein
LTGAGLPLAAEYGYEDPVPALAAVGTRVAGSLAVQAVAADPELETIFYLTGGGIGVTVKMH